MHRGSWKSSSSPRIAGVQCSSTVGSTLWGMAPVVAVVLGIILDSISPNQRSRTRFPLGDGSGVTTCPRGGNARHLWPRTRTPAGGLRTSTCHPDSRGWVRDLHVPSGLPRALGSASCSGGVRSRHVSRRCGRGRRSRRRPGSSGLQGRCCGGFHPTGVAWRRSEGPTGQGLLPVKGGAASEGRVHTVRGLRGRESMKEVWRVGSIVAGAVPSTSCAASQVPTASPQRPKWRSSDRSWRTRLRSPPLWGMAV